MNLPPPRRRAGVLVPLFSCPSIESWGIGDIGDLVPMTAWLARAGQHVLQLLPINEMATGQHSPYSAISAMAIDPIYIRVQAVPDFTAAGGESVLSASERSELERVRRSGQIDYTAVRRLKEAALRAAFDRFHEFEWPNRTERSRGLSEFLASRAWWVEDYALFRALYDRYKQQSWMTWPDGLRRREPPAVDQARRELSREVLYYQYLQWIADTQWHEARKAATNNGVALFGDLPFMVDRNSADVWSRQQQFLLDASVGVPPDAFSATGQDWGLPVYRWDIIEIDDFRWLRSRARRTADLFDGFRVDHLVGFYRTYARPHDGTAAFFTPATEPEQTALGEKLLNIFRGAGAEVVAEDLGTVPDFVRASLARLGVAGFKVFRWERNWHAEGHPFRDSSDYPVRSVATSGTHDTTSLAEWWQDEASEDERHAVADLPTVRRIANGGSIFGVPFNPVVRDTLLEAICASRSELTVVPIGDIFGWRDRINEPATVGEANWTFRLPWPVDQLEGSPDAHERREAVRSWAERHNRIAPP